MKPYLIANPLQRPYWIAAIILLSIFACKKGDHPSTSPKTGHAFTILSDSADQRLRQYTDSLLVREAALPWMDSVMASIGSPGWQYASFGDQNGAPSAMIPLIDRGAGKVTGLLVMSNGKNGFRFRVIDSRKPERYGFDNGENRANARTIFFATDMFNQRAFPDADPAPMTDPCMMTRSERKYVENARRSQGGGTITLRAMPYALSITCYTTVACTGDGNGNCIGNIVTSTDCVYNYIWVDDWSNYPGGGNGDPDGDYGGGVGGGGGGGSAPNSPGPGPCGAPGTNPDGGPLAILPPLKPVDDVHKYLSCFDPAIGAKLTFYADQPQAGSDEPFTTKGKVGHAYISIEQFSGGRIIRRTVGFHPYEAVSPFFTKKTDGQLGDDSNEEYDVRMDVNISAGTLTKVLSMIENHNPDYHLETYNCTNFVLDISDACGVNIPRNKSSWIFGKGLNPGRFGEDLKKLPGAVKGQGKSGENIGDCN